MKPLIAFFSRPGENYFSGQIRSVAEGNTEKAARMIEKETGGVLFPIDMKKPYSDDYNTCTDEAQEDLKKDVRPDIEPLPKDVEDYDVIYLGYPIYWGTFPRAVATFLEKIDTKGKTIRPFCTHEGSGFGRSLRELEKLCPDAVIGRGLALKGSSVGRSEDLVKLWVEEE